MTRQLLISIEVLNDQDGASDQSRPSSGDAAPPPGRSTDVHRYRPPRDEHRRPTGADQANAGRSGS